MGEISMQMWHILFLATYGIRAIQIPLLQSVGLDTTNYLIGCLEGLTAVPALQWYYNSAIRLNNPSIIRHRKCIWGK